MEPPIGAGSLTAAFVRPSKASPQSRPRSAPRPQPEIGILTAIPREFHAVRAMFDIIAPSPEEHSYAPSRVNWYEHGSIAGRSVVMANSRQGNSAAAVSATAMLHDFDSISLLVMLGIAGGVPSPEDAAHHVRLGDVVISTEAIVEYDFRKLETGNEWQRKWSEKPPGHLVDQIVNRLEHRIMSGQRPWEPMLADILTHMSAQRPATDQLYSSTGLVPHPMDAARTEGVPRLHRGRIGSASILLKHAALRDMLRDRYDIRAVEMEGAGVAEAAYRTNTPYVVIRGIADYCDSHKNDEWQDYAAAAASAFCRVFLQYFCDTLPQQ